MRKLQMLWEACPGETAVYGTIALVSAAMMAALLGLLMWPTEPDEMEEIR